MSMNGHGPPSAWISGTEQEQDYQALVRELSRVYDERDDARLLAIKAGLRREDVPAFGSPSVFWMKVMLRARDGAVSGGIERIRAAAAEKYPSNPVFSPPPRAPLVTQHISREPARRSGGLSSDALHVIVGMLAFALLVSWGLVYSMSEDSLSLPTLAAELSEPDVDEPRDDPEAPPRERVADMPAPKSWTCVSFRSPHAHSSNGRLTTCRAEAKYCTRIEQHQAKSGNHPSECIELVGPHPAEIFGTRKDTWKKSEVSKQGIEGWLFPYGDLLLR